MTQDEERTARTADFEVEANAVRPGWTLAGEEWEIAGEGGERWQATIRGHIGLVWQAGRGWCFMILDGAEPSKILDKGISSRRGWAMDACETYAPQSH